MKHKVLAMLVNAAVLGMLANGAPTANATPSPAPPPLLDTMVNNQVNPCATRPIDGGTTNGYEKEAATFTVNEPAKVSSVVLPLSVAGGGPATIQVTIVGTKPFLGDPTGSSTGSFWDWIPDETAELGRTTATVRVASVPCGQPEIVTAKFKRAVRVYPGSTYWVVAQNPAGETRTFQWNVGTTVTAVSTHAIYIVDSNGSRWLAYDPETFGPTAMRVIRK